jgi:hypothetical protein
MSDAPASQDGVERCSDETAVARFGNDDIRLHRAERIDKRVVPAALGQKLTFEFGPLAHHAQGIRLELVGGQRAAGLLIVRVPAVLQKNDLHASLAHLPHQSGDARDDAFYAGKIEPGYIEIAAL